MKTYIFTLSFFIFCTLSYAQSQFGAVVVVLKNQDTIRGQGRFGNNTFKFRNSKVDKVRKIEYHEIDLVKIGKRKGEVVTYKCLPVKNQSGYFPIEEVYKGKNVQLYFSAIDYTAPKDLFGSRVSSSGYGFGIGPVAIVFSKGFYYAKRSFEDVLTPLSKKNLKKRVKIYFSNCPSLLEKIDNKTYSLKKDLKEIFKFYDENCN